jgi:hypothetical protein
MSTRRRRIPRKSGIKVTARARPVSLLGVEKQSRQLGYVGSDAACLIAREPLHRMWLKKGNHRILGYRWLEKPAEKNKKAPLLGQAV